MSRLRPIPAPLSRRWREFRFEYLPALAFGVSLLAAAVMWQEHAMPRKATGSDWPEKDAVENEVPASIVSGPVATASPIPVNASYATNPPPVLSD